MPSYLPLHISAFLAINLMLLALSHAAVAKSARFKHFPAPRFLSTARAALTAQREAFDANIPAHKSFRIIKDEFVEEYSLRALMYEHDGTGAQVLSIICEDENKVFGITFPTPVSDSTGLPHVLEHSVLCGSRKYPTKEPFVHLLKGSLNTFLNAFTYPDRTCYPVASMNSKDFYNLIDVYLDAVFYPRAISDPRVLAQEGWHYSLEDIEAPLIYKGVVYNEMKGVYSSPEAVLSRITQHALFPNNSYGHDSGGDPEDIPNMTFDSLRSFHSKHYHPGHSKIFFYGNDDPIRRLDLIDDYLKDFTRPKSSEPVVKYQARFKEPKLVEMFYPTSSADEKKHIYTVNWVLNEKPLDHKEKLAMSVLNHLMFGTADSVMRKALMESLLGDGVVSNLEDELLQSTLQIGMRGVPPENRAALHSLLFETLIHVSISGFEKSAVQASMNTIEFHLREFNTGGYPKGLSVMLGVMPDWIYGRYPVDAIKFEKALSDLKSDVASNKTIFQDLIKRFILDNQHCVVVDLKPDSEFESKRLSLEISHLDLVKAKMEKHELEAVVESTRALLEAQAAEDTPEAKATLPRLEMCDIDKNNSEVPTIVENLPGYEKLCNISIERRKLLSHVLTTNGILYANIAVDFGGISVCVFPNKFVPKTFMNVIDVMVEDLELLPLFARMLTQSGTLSLDSASLSRKIGTETGGITASYYSGIRQRSGVVSNPDDALLYFVMSGKVVSDKIDSLFEIFEDIICSARLDNQKRAVEILRQSKASRESSVISSGHSYAATRLGAQNSVLGYYREVTSGLTYARALDRLLFDAENNWNALLTRLLLLRSTLLLNMSKAAVINLTGDKDLINSSKPLVGHFLENITACSSSTVDNNATGTPFLPRWNNELLFPVRNEGFIMPSQVNYVVKGGSILAPGEHVSGSFAVAARYLNTGYLWDTVRVMGGAYGCSGSFGAASGRYIFSSYRDPNVLSTLQAYDKGSDSIFADCETLTDSDVLEAIIGSIGDLDSPQSPDQKGYTGLIQFLSGSTPADRQQWRDEVLATRVDDFKAFGDRLSTLKEKSSIIVFGGRPALDAANSLLDEGQKLVLEHALRSSSAVDAT